MSSGDELTNDVSLLGCKFNPGEAAKTGKAVCCISVICRDAGREGEEERQAGNQGSKGEREKGGSEKGWKREKERRSREKKSA